MPLSPNRNPIYLVHLLTLSVVLIHVRGAVYQQKKVANIDWWGPALWAPALCIQNFLEKDYTESRKRGGHFAAFFEGYREIHQISLC